MSLLQTTTASTTPTNSYTRLRQILAQLKMPMAEQTPRSSDAAKDVEVPTNNEGDGTATTGSGKSEEEIETERLYEERMEEEYAKREGGA
ncbi:hypothetical protein BJ875DRAFT_455105 [Amylocarpus encephaloides]|uniref:Uncharacterized protein n=1 Tax=Amylocarpus encephaloides TaxID=45428 RepID=A0A9P7YNS7_9HELO|nr:hypothetical protein BJ875DRAFT_455105 [Amylocarpus encephaloides]